MTTLAETAMTSLNQDSLNETLPGRLVLRAAERTRKVALRDKNFGVWDEITWTQYLENVLQTAARLIERGVQPGDHVAILSENSPEWVYADLASQTIGASSVGIYPTNSATEVAYILAHCAARVVVVEDQEQLDKIIEIRSEVPALETVVIVDPRGTREYSVPGMLTWAQFFDAANPVSDQVRQDLLREIESLDPDQPCTVVYTSGTTGPPKGAMLSHANLVATGESLVAGFGWSDKEEILSYLPLCHIGEKMWTLLTPLTIGLTVNFGESTETVTSDLREVAPTVFLAVPRIWEKLHSGTYASLNRATWLKKKVLGYFLKIGESAATTLVAGKRLSPWHRFQWLVGEVLVYRPLRERLGLRRTWFVGSAAAPVAPELLAWFRGIRVPIGEGYGMTESGGSGSFNVGTIEKTGTVGRPLPGVEIKLGDGGELLIRSGGVFKGYLHNEAATKETFTEDGWLKSGDVATIDDDGYIKITGRMKDIIITSGGKNLSPALIENLLKTSLWIKEAVIIGDARKYVTALIEIDYENASDWASERGIVHGTFEDLAKNDQVRELIAGEINRLNDQLARVEQVKKFKLLTKQLDRDDDELTATQKVRRNVFLVKYADMIEEMYS